MTRLPVWLKRSCWRLPGRPIGQPVIDCPKLFCGFGLHIHRHIFSAEFAGVETHAAIGERK